jgi:hypothetical protein
MMIRSLLLDPSRVGLLDGMPAGVLSRSQRNTEINSSFLLSRGYVSGIP